MLQLPRPQASSTLRPQAQVLGVFDEILHCPVDMRSNRLIPPLDLANAALITISILVMIAAFHVALTTRNVFPQAPDLDGFPDIPADHVAIEEVSSMDVIALTIIPVTLLHRVDVADKMFKDRIAFMRDN